jgi:uncharacterized protein YkwD
MKRRSLRWAALAVALASIALPSPPPATGGVDPGARSGPASFARVERAIRACANRNRRAAGLDALSPSSVLDRAARLHARDMAVQGFFDHVDPQGRDPADRVAIFDGRHEFTFVGENIAAGYPSAQASCAGWMASPGHRANILEPDYTHLGAGFARGGPYGRYYVQVFARSNRFDLPPTG